MAATLFIAETRREDYDHRSHGQWPGAVLAAIVPDCAAEAASYPTAEHSSTCPRMFVSSAEWISDRGRCDFVSARRIRANGARTPSANRWSILDTVARRATQTHRRAPDAVTRGILNSSLVHPREVFVHAIVARAASVILCHNHPSGDPTPSPDDRAVTEQLVAAGRLLDIPVHDHVIIGRVGTRALPNWG